MFLNPNGRLMSFNSGSARVASAVARVRDTRTVMSAICAFGANGGAMLRFDRMVAWFVNESLFLTSWSGSDASPMVVE